MKTKSCFLAAVLLCLLAASMSAQTPVLHWVKQIGGVGSESLGDIATDASGNVFTVGIFYDTVDIDPGVGVSNIISANNGDVFIQKLDANGNFLWAKEIYGSGIFSGININLDKSGNIFIAGSFTDTADFDPGIGTMNLISAGSYDIFLLKLDSSGNMLWVKQIGGISEDRFRDMTIDENANIIITGLFAGITDFDPGIGTATLIATAGIDIFMLKLDSSGSYLWANKSGGSGNGIARIADTDADGNIYSIGYFSGTIDFNPGTGQHDLTSAGYDDIYVQKLDAAGNFLWAHSFGSSGFDWGYGLHVDMSSNV